MDNEFRLLDQFVRNLSEIVFNPDIQLVAELVGEGFCISLCIFLKIGGIFVCRSEIADDHVDNDQVSQIVCRAPIIL